MPKDLLANIELKSLRILALLIRHHSVSIVADKMAMQPSSVTYHLNKLRDVFSDPLLIQVGRKMTPTKKALSLEPKIVKLITDVQSIIAPEQFDPKNVNQTFRIAMQDIGGEVVMPILIAQLRVLAPNIKIDLINWPKDAEQQLLEGKIDIAINAIAKHNSQLYGYQLSNMSLSIVTNKHHALAEKALNIGDIFDYPHVRFTPTSLAEKRVDELALKLGKQRNIVASASTFSVLSAIIRSSDIVGIFSTDAAKQLGTSNYFSHRIDDVDSIPLHCFWHQRVHNDDAHKFVRGLIIEIAQEFLKNTGS